MTPFVPQANAFVSKYNTAFTAPLTYRDISYRQHAYGTRVMESGLTVYDACLARDYGLWNDLVAHGGLVKYCCPKGRKPYANRPWIVMPAEGRRFKPIAVLALNDPSVVFNGTDILVPFTTLANVYVPLGYDGVITDVIMNIDPDASGVTGFVEGSGDITWRLKISQQLFARDFGAIITSVGSLISPSPVPRGGIRVRSRDQLQFFVSLTAGAAGRLNPGARIVCSITGWFYPR